MHRFYIEETPLRVGDTVDLQAIHRQLSRVLRMRAGDQIVLFNGNGDEYVAELCQLSRSSAMGVILSVNQSVGEPVGHLTLYQCALKGDRMEWVLQKCTELGVSKFVPVISERTIVRPAESLVRRYDRWRSIIREAAEQSGRGTLAILEKPLSWDEAVRDAWAASTQIRVTPYEVHGDQPSLISAISSQMRDDTAPSVSILVGPEGGISDAEIDEAIDYNWRPVTLGPRILRAETAAIAGVTTIMAALGEMA